MLCLIFALLVACSTTERESANVVNIFELTPGSTSLAIGASVVLAPTGTTKNGAKIDLSGVAVEWTSSNVAVATVDGGRVRARAPGTATITGTVMVGRTPVSGYASIVVVDAALLELTISPTSALLTTGSSRQLAAMGKYSDAATRDISADVTWSSSDSTVASIDAFGRLLALIPGTADITATLGSLSGHASARVTDCTTIAHCTNVTCTTQTDQSCSACAAGFFLSNNACVPCSGACNGGQYESAACSPTADRVCSSCTAVSSCASATCTSVSDSTCAACTGGHYLAGGVCPACSGACPAGQAQSAACTATSDRACTSCTVIANCTTETCADPANPTCLTCAGGFFLRNNACVPCSGACGSGQFQSAACSANADRACTTCTGIANCASATCTSSTNQTCGTCNPSFYAAGGTCHACSGACAPGQYQSLTCSANADRTCATCGAVANCTNVVCTTNADQTCNTCGNGYYRTAGGTCAACSGACASGTYQASACSASADRTCQSCTPIANCATETCTTNANQSCATCNNGYYQNGGACSSCTAACPSGKYKTADCSTNADLQCGTCTAIAHCTNETCTSATNQACTSCDPGFDVVGGACTCHAGTLECNGACVDPLSDTQYCGATAGCGMPTGSAGVACSAGEVCASGTCVARVTITADTNLSQVSTGARVCPDGGDMVAYSVQGFPTTTSVVLTSTVTAGCLEIGDTVMLANLQGTSGTQANVGNFELLQVASLGAAGGVTTVGLTAAKVGFYGDGAADDTNIGVARGNQRVVLQRVPTYTQLVVASGATVTGNAWNGVTGGVFALRATSVTVNGSIDMSARGYTGGAYVPFPNRCGDQGESINGLGLLGAVNGIGTRGPNIGAGGAGSGDSNGCRSYGAGGAGGGYGTGGAWAADTGCGGVGGGTYGSGALTKLFFGSGGGSGGTDNTLGDNPPGGYGGAGGGIVYMASATVNGTGVVRANGSDGQGDISLACFGWETDRCWDWSGPGGGGSGGSVRIDGATVSVSRVANGGAGGRAIGAAGNGGGGGQGRVTP